MSNGRTMRLVLYASAAIIIGTTIVQYEPSTRATSFSDGDRQMALGLWNEVIQSKGGRERLREVASLFVTLKRGQGDRTWNFYLLPNRYFHYSYGSKREDTVIKVFNGNLGIIWWQPNQSPAQLRRLTAKDEDDALIIEAQFILLLETRWLQPKPMGTRREWVGLKRVDVIETDVAGWRVDYYLDPTSRLPLKITFGVSSIERARGEMNHEVRLRGYFKVGELMMPRKITHTLNFGDNRRQWSEEADFEINPRYHEKIFEQAPTGKLGPEAWRRLSER